MSQAGRSVCCEFRSTARDYARSPNAAGIYRSRSPCLPRAPRGSSLGRDRSRARPALHRTGRSRRSDERLHARLRLALTRRPEFVLIRRQVCGKKARAGEDGMKWPRRPQPFPCRTDVLEDRVAGGRIDFVFDSRQGRPTGGLVGLPASTTPKAAALWLNSSLLMKFRASTSRLAAPACPDRAVSLSGSRPRNSR